MGKFFEALKKAERSEKLRPPEPTEGKVVKISNEEIDEMRLDNKVLEEANGSNQEPSTDIDSRLVSLLEPNSAAAECFKILRTKIFCRDNACGPRTIMVTSSRPLDGKSLVAANLAVSMAQGINEYVLLVDCDLRRPSLHEVFGLKSNQGLREYLEDGTSIAPYLMETPVDKLTLLPAGQSMASPSELLGSEKMQQLIAEIKGRYQNSYVIIDTPPAQFNPEIVSLNPMVDGILLVVRSGKSPKEPVEEVVKLVGRESILGVVFNAAEEVQQQYSHYYRYYNKSKA